MVQKQDVALCLWNEKCTILLSMFSFWRWCNL